MPSAQSLPTLVLPRERALAKLRAGRPLLHDEPVVLDLERATELFVRLAEEHRLDVSHLDLAGLLTEAFVQHADHIEQLSGGQVLTALAEEAVRPLRRAYADRLSALVRVWERGYCAICGFSPGQAGAVHCAACGFAWQAAAPEPAFRIELAVPDEDA
jgi:hypothetical protein